jgi:hypothetical protein
LFHDFWSQNECTTFSQPFLFSINKGKTEITILLTLLGRPTGTVGPQPFSASHARAREKASRPSSGSGPRPFGREARPEGRECGHDGDHGGAAVRVAGRRPLPAMTGNAKTRTGSVRGRRTRQGKARGTRSSGDALSPVRPSAAAP